MHTTPMVDRSRIQERQHRWETLLLTLAVITGTGGCGRVGYEKVNTFIEKLEAKPAMVCPGEDVEVCWKVVNGFPFFDPPPSEDLEAPIDPESCAVFHPTSDFNLKLKALRISSADGGTLVSEDEKEVFVNVVATGDTWTIGSGGSCMGNQCTYPPVVFGDDEVSASITIGTISNHSSDPIQVTHETTTMVIPGPGSTPAFEGHTLKGTWTLAPRESLTPDIPVIRCDTSSIGDCGYLQVTAELRCP